MKLPILAVITFLLVLGGCKSAYYSTWEKLGWKKRDLLADKVVDARDEQQKASEQFKTTLERFKELTGFEGGALEASYSALKRQYEMCESRAKAVSKRIKDVDEVAQDMFREWESELEQYSNSRLRASSEQKLKETRQRYSQLIGTMRKAEARMPPVLAQFRDHVPYLKHNLNAQAIASLQGTTQEIELNVNDLIKEMDAAIAEANEFIGTLQ